MSPTRHVLIALSLTALLFVIAGDSWGDRIGAIKPVRVADRGA
jgi:hypothetical protein